MKRNVPVFATILTMCAFSFLCVLGVWQVQRLHWKDNLIADIAAARAAGPRDIGFHEIGGKEDILYARLRGRYGADVFPVGPRTYEGLSGYHLVVPLIMKGSGVVLVNRGWVPQGQERDASPPSGIITVSGLLRPPGSGNPFVPANDPAQNRWFRIDTAQMAAAAGFEAAAPLVMYAESETPESASLQPVRAALQWTPPNHHRQYAFFWFSMAGILLVIYYFRFWRPGS